MLSRAGYTVLEAASGEEALVVSAGHVGPIDLLVADVVLPASAAATQPHGWSPHGRICGRCTRRATRTR